MTRTTEAGGIASREAAAQGSSMPNAARNSVRRPRTALQGRDFRMRAPADKERSRWLRTIKTLIRGVVTACKIAFGEREHLPERCREQQGKG